MKKCCSNCFEDFYLISYILENGKEDKCDFCRQSNNKCIYLNDEIFYKMFNFIKKMYIEMPVRRSERISYYILDEWNIFSANTNGHKILENLCNIYNFDYNNYYVFNPDYYTYFNIWHDFQNTIKHKNRFINSLPSEIETLFTSPNFDRFRLLHTENILYRARLGSEDPITNTPYPPTLDAMGIPPIDKVKSGRANPHGIPYLYLASGIETAIAEVRPWCGSFVSIASFKILESLSVVNFSSFHEISLFNLINDDEDQALKRVYFFKRVGIEMSQPISPNDSYIEYIPTQYLTEFIKFQGYDGLIFDSSLGPGQNVVLFNQKNLEITNTEIYKIDQIRYNYCEL